MISLHLWPSAGSKEVVEDWIEGKDGLLGTSSGEFVDGPIVKGLATTGGVLAIDSFTDINSRIVVACMICTSEGKRVIAMMLPDGALKSSE